MNKHCCISDFYIHFLKFASSIRSLSFSLWEIVAAYRVKLTKVVRVCPGLLSPALLLVWGGRKGGRKRRGMGGGGRHSPFRHIFSQSLILAFLLFFFSNSIHPLKTTTYEVAKCFCRRDGCSRRLVINVSNPDAL